MIKNLRKSTLNHQIPSDAGRPAFGRLGAFYPSPRSPAFRGSRRPHRFPRRALMIHLVYLIYVLFPHHPTFSSPSHSPSSFVRSRRASAASPVHAILHFVTSRISPSRAARTRHFARFTRHSPCPSSPRPKSLVVRRRRPSRRRPLDARSPRRRAPRSRSPRRAPTSNVSPTLWPRKNRASSRE